MYRIEKNVPIPPIDHGGKRKLSDVMRRMKKGESLSFNKKRYRTVSTLAGRLFGTGKYTIRSNGTTARVWRT